MEPKEQNNIITVIKNKENTITFDVTIEGIDSNDIDVKWAIKTNSFELMFPCAKLSEASYKVVLPPMPLLDTTSYPFVIYVFVDGYFFAPASGIMNIVPSPEIYTTEPTNVTIPPEKIEAIKQPDYEEETEEESKEETEFEVTITTEDKKFKEAEKIAESIINEEKPTSPNKEEKLKQILNEYNSKSKKKTVFKKGKVVSR